MIYKYSREEAQRSGELDLYRESRKENIACKHSFGVLEAVTAIIGLQTTLNRAFLHVIFFALESHLYRTI